MLPFAISWPNSCAWLPNTLNSGFSIQYIPLYSMPVQMTVPPPVQKNQAPVRSEQLGTKGYPVVEFEPMILENEIRHRRSQNPYRNVLTNITNLILNFMVCPKKASQLLLSIDSTLTEEDEFQFYQYVRDLKKHFCSYYNPIKLKNLFQGKSLPKYKVHFHHLFRVAAKIILEERIPLCLMTSKKISEELRKQHFHARRIILSILKYGSAPNENRYSITL